MVLKLFLIYYVIGQINKCVDALRARVFTLEEETYKYLTEGNRLKKKNNPVEMDWNWRYQCAVMISRLCMGMYIHMCIYSAASARKKGLKPNTPH